MLPKLINHLRLLAPSFGIRLLLGGFLAVVLGACAVWTDSALGAPVLAMLSAWALRSLLWRPVARLEAQVRGLEGLRLETLGERESLLKRNAELEQALSALQLADQAKASFIATMSHEVRTPLMGVLGAASVLEDLGGLDHQQLDLLRTVSASSDCLLAQINDVLDYSKATASVLELEEGVVEVGPWIEEAVSVMSGRTRDNGLVLTAVVAADAPRRVSGDGQRLRQALLNLLGNAAKFTTEGSIAIRVKACVLGLRLEIEDTGPGLPEGRDPMELFEAFKQGQEHCPGGESGTGLGLSISRVFVEGMGGTVGACDTGTGAMFWIELPGVPDVAASSLASMYEELPSAFSLQGKQGVLMDAVRAQLAQWKFKTGGELGAALQVDELNHVSSPTRLLELIRPSDISGERPATRLVVRELSVLVVDDNPVNRKVLESMLKRLGHRSTLAEDGDAAVELFARERFDLVLLDYHMPRMGGPEASRAMCAYSLRTDQVHPTVVAVSAAVSFKERQACADAGMDDILTKPFRIDELRHMLGERFGVPSQQAQAA